MDVILRIENICCTIGGREILHEVSLELGKGEVLGLVGESGSGKSTLARVTAGLMQEASGSIWLADECLGSERDLSDVRGGYEERGEMPRETSARRQQLSVRRDKQTRRRIQMVFQDPSSSLNPRHTIGKILDSAIAFHRGSLSGRYSAGYLVERLGLPEDTLKRYPASFSGGQKQRIALARALCLEPDILIADEPTSALDVSVQYSILELIKELQREMGLSVIFISHDLGVIRYLCSRLAVMKDGRIVEYCGAEEFFKCPGTAYGRELLSSVPAFPS